MQSTVLYTMRKCKVLFCQLEANIFAEEITPINLNNCFNTGVSKSFLRNISSFADTNSLPVLW